MEWRPKRGKLRRRTFSDEEDAGIEADHIEKLFAEGLRIVADLPIQNLIGIAMIMQQIPNVPVIEIFQFYLQTHELNSNAPAVVGLRVAGQAFVESRSDEDNYSLRWRQDVKNHVGRLMDKFGNQPVSGLKVEALQDYIANDVGGSPRTRFNHVTTLSAFGRWMRTKKKWLPFTVPSALEELEKPRTGVRV